VEYNCLGPGYQNSVSWSVNCNEPNRVGLYIYSFFQHDSFKIGLFNYLKYSFIHIARSVL
jgi:hypothetical protein